MCRLVSITVVGITMALLAGMSGNALAYDPNVIENYSRFSLSPVVIEADAILVGVPKYFRFGEDANLVRLDDLHFLFDNGTPAIATPGRFVVISPKHPGWGSPVIVDGRKQLLFVRRKVADDSFRKEFDLDKADRVFTLCNPWQSSICLDFSIVSLPKNIAEKRYGIHDPEVIVDVVKKLTRWRTEKASKEEAVRQLLTLLKSTKGQTIYEENIPPILAHLGTKVVKQGDEFIIEKPAKQQDPAPTEEGAGSQAGK